MTVFPTQRLKIQFNPSFVKSLKFFLVEKKNKKRRKSEQQLVCQKLLVFESETDLFRSLAVSGSPRFTNLCQLNDGCFGKNVCPEKSAENLRRDQSYKTFLSCKSGRRKIPPKIPQYFVIFAPPSNMHFTCRVCCT